MTDRGDVTICVSFHTEDLALLDWELDGLPERVTRAAALRSMLHSYCRDELLAKTDPEKRLAWLRRFDG